MKHLKQWRIPILLLIDGMFINIAYVLAMYFRFSFDLPSLYQQNFKSSIQIIIGIFYLFFLLFGIYKSLWSYAGTDEFLLVIAACFLATLSSILITNLLSRSLPYSVQILAGIFATILICGFRISFRIYRRVLMMVGRHKLAGVSRIMLIGGGAASALLIKEMKTHRNMMYEPVAIIDDDKFKLGTAISGIKVVGNRHRIQDVAEKMKVDIILMAIPSISNEERKELLDICKKTGCKIKTVPGVYELIDNEYLLNKIRDVDVEDLLGRESVKLDMDGISEYLENQVVLVTGGGGSIGSELCRQIIRFSPKELIILDIYENNVYDLQNELLYKYPKLNLKVIIASVRDKKRIDNIFNEYQPDVVFHAAAHKHVPLMEFSPSEAVKNNVFGTLNVAEAADKYGVNRFVMISTDKAVNPTNIMGASKRMCEMVIQGMDRVSQTEFVAVRFGNVLGSNGSVIPLFKKQIEHGGPVTLTHKEITRFFMTIPEAAQLVLQAGAYANGGEIFVLDMGSPVKIYDLAHDLISLSGLEPGRDIEIKITGLRPGEKLYEELLMDEEGLSITNHDKIFIGKPIADDIDKLKSKLQELRFILDSGNKNEIGFKIAEIVPTYLKKNNDEAEASLAKI